MISILPARFQFAGDAGEPITEDPTTESDVIDRIVRMRCRVLVVDDDDLFRDSLVKRLEEDYGAVVVQAEDATIAMEKLTELPPFDIVLMDVLMGETDGFEAAKQMREAGVFGLIVFMSTDAGNRELARQREATFLFKPSDDYEAFASALEQILLHCRGDKRS